MTYSRLPPDELYHTSVEGIAGGLGRALVFTNYPTALLAVPVALLAAERLRPSRAAAGVALGAGMLCLTTPFVVQQADLDARPGNALPALGVALTIALVVRAWRRFEGPARRLAGDPVRLVLAVGLALVAVPWVFAELGFYAPDPIFADERRPGDPLPAVHLGRHHGMDGVMLALASLAISRLLPAARGALGAAASFLLALVLAYGAANAAQDGWLEQVEKRGWADVGLPSMTLPSLSLAWALLLVAAVGVELLWFRRERPPYASGGRRPAV